MYRRFLIDNDYYSILSREAFEQLIHGLDDRVWEAEEASEASLIEYLHGKFEIEKALEVGKIITDYNPQVTYPVGAHFILNGTIVRALKTINGNKRPSQETYWELFDEPIEVMTKDEEERLDAHSHYSPESSLEDAITGNVHEFNACIIKKSRKYSQRRDYINGDIVNFSGLNYICVVENGPSYENIQIPGIVGWKEIETTEWIKFVDNEIGDVVSYRGNFYALLSKDAYNNDTPPADAPDSVWGEIAYYDPEEHYEFKDDEWVVFEGHVYVPTMEPNASELISGTNYTVSDPRNGNIKKQLLRMAVYELHKIIAPHNISSARITDYEAALQWLQDAARMKIDPGIPRCIDRRDHKPVTSYGLATFKREYNPMENEWQI